MAYQIIGWRIKLTRLCLGRGLQESYIPLNAAKKEARRQAEGLSADLRGCPKQLGASAVVSASDCLGGFVGALSVLPLPGNKPIVFVKFK